MRNKLLALILALTMAIGLVAMTPVAVAAEGVETVGRDVVLEAAELLVTLNIVQGYEDGSLGLEKNITRAEFASMLARMLQGTDELNLNAGAIVNTKMSETPENIAAVKAAEEAKVAFGGAAGASAVNVGKSYQTDIDSTELADPAFSDISELHWAYNDVEYLRGQGIVTGYTDGTFKPDNNILYEEAVKFVVSALGYDFMAVTYGGYPEGYIKTANQLKILKNVNGANGVAATRQQIMVLLYNALTADYLVLDEISGQYNVYEADKNILNYVFGLDIIEKCYVVANEVSGIDSYYHATDKGTIEIGEESGLGGTVFKIYNDSYKDLLGYRVKAYVKYDEFDDKKGELYCMFPYEKTKKVTFKSEDIFNVDVDDNMLEIYVGDDEYEFELAEEPDVIYNDVAYARNLTDATFDLESGDITLVSTTGTKVYDVIYINEYIPVYVETVKNSGKTVIGTSYYNGATHEKYTLDLDVEKAEDEGKEIVVNVVKADGTKGTVADIKADTVINVKMWANRYTIELGGKKVTGSVAKKGTGFVVIGDTKYEEIEDSAILGDYKKNSSLTLGVNKDGYVFYAKAQAGIGALSYGLIMDIAVDEEASGFTEVVKIKLMDTAGKKQIYTIAENMKFTDMGTATYRYNDEGKENSITLDELKAMLKKSAKYASLQNGTGYASVSAKRPYEQLVKYALDANGEIKEIVTAMPSSQVPKGEEKSAYFTFEDVNVSGTAYHINAGIIYGTPYIVNGAIMFRASKTNPATDDRYAVGKWSTGARDGGHGHVLFDVGEDGKVAAVITGNDSGTGSTSANEYGNWQMVEYMQDTILDFEGEAEDGYEIGFIANGAYQTKYAIISKSYEYGYLGANTDYNIGDVTNPYTWSKGGYWYGNYNISSFDNVDAGAMTIDGDSTKTFTCGFYPIKAVLSRIIEGTYDMCLHATDGAESWGKWEREIVFGRVRSVANGNVIVEYGDGAAQAIVCTVNGKKAAIYDCETGFVRAGNATEVAEGDWVLLQMSNKEFKTMFIYTNTDMADLDNIQKYENERD